MRPVWEIADRLVCSREKKAELLPLIRTIIDFSKKARRFGLLSLERDVPDCRYSFLKYGLQLVVDGTDPKVIDDILSTRIIASGKRGNELIEQLICATAALSIQAGDNPSITMQRSLAYFGNDADSFEEELLSYSADDAGDAAIVEEYVRSDGAVPGCFSESRRILAYDDRSVQKILREIDMPDLVAAMNGSDREVRQKITRNMSRRAAILLATESLNPPDEAETKRYVAKLTELMAGLVEKGTIPPLS